jgi:MFS family permease
MGQDSAITVITQFVTAVSWSYVYVFIPFYVRAVSPHDRQATLLWIGLIVGVSGATSAVTAPFVGAMAGRWRPKRLLQLGILFQGLLIAALAATDDLPALLVLRFLIGTIGGLSTIGMVVVSATSPPDRLTTTMGVFQAAITLGHVVGPLLGAVTAELLGFQGAFLLGGGIMAAAYGLCHWGMTDIPAFSPPAGGERVRGRRLVGAWLLCFAASVQITFLPGVLPEILALSGVPPGRAVRLGSLIVFSYGVASILGSYAIARAAARWGERRALAAAAVGGSALLPLLAYPASPVAFGALRFAQAGLIAGAIPIVFAEVAAASTGRTIGLINTSRFAAFAAGPVLGAWCFAHGSPLGLYLTLSLGTLAILPLLGRSSAA